MGSTTGQQVEVKARPERSGACIALLLLQRSLAEERSHTFEPAMDVG